MGSNVAPAYANAFMARLEELHIYLDVDFARHCLAWWRYMDDVFVVWRGDVDSLQRFHDRINEVHPSISFSLIFDLQKIYFLDVLVYRDQGGHLHTSLFTKPTDRNQILYYTSYHPPHLKKIYPNQPVVQEKTIQQAQYMVEYPRTKKKQSNRIPFVTQFHADSEAVGKVLRRHWYLLQNAYPMIQKIKTMPLISYRKGRTIGAQVTSTQMKTKTIDRTFLGCRSKGNMTLPVSKHFLEKGHTADQLKFMVLETIPPLKRGGDRELKLKQREVWWIKQLGSLYPSVLNKEYDLFLFP
ncbi:hypothetical protein XELAEV_18022864mg [Xenopus laevis]|uniref:Reverse transcriptase domain-containing protein n=1 Tax=Xenopus laevis TaxID=8355 RepID=A0A974HP36_XENLA|nr:hypothetical protein XELAEV_18022864mg [Xenopus laevis]